MNIKKLAIKIAKEAFKDKLDIGGTSYYIHCKKVAQKSVKKVPLFFIETNEWITQKYLDDIFVVGLLHDLIEDCNDWNIENLIPIFNKEIIEAIQLLTKKENQDYSEYINILKNNKYALIVKLSDLEHNMDVSRLKKLEQKDFERLKKYVKTYNDLKDYCSNNN